ncbi:hypothetical protein JKI95_09245 [Corynebacterium aquatimens]|uniref:DNA-binding protein n=1 Tax=Corynebacterium stercoris TaxID=2943490 RepID=A0ABT1FYU4_9CORY|nr:MULTISPECIES: hypothetical protein [Corynebacterium]MCP1386939.1 hypothetical protein [Corynebacterium stercoris]QYH19320.1 hypothetical protein JKI95_09245 [Corynebacterium aquatimens]UIZ91785.1 hypothetical protein JZY91_08655 [Corynebacterium sp. CNCTC7651]
MDTTLLVEIRLREWCRHLRDEIEPEHSLGGEPSGWCRWIESHAAAIAKHEEAWPFLIAINEMRRRMSEIVDGPAEEQRAENRVSAATAARRMQVKPDDVRQWVRDGLISVERDSSGSLFVLMSEVRQFVEENCL